MAGDAGARWLAVAAIVVSVAAVLAVWRAATPPVPLAPVAWREIAPPADAPAREWRWIIVHHSASEGGTAAGIDHEHSEVRGWEGIGYHFVIGNGRGMPLGRIEATFRWRGQRQGAHAHSIEHNEHGIGICLIGDFERDEPDPRQLERLVDLCATLIQHVPGLSVERILGHKDVKPSTLCPGKHLDLDALRARVADRIGERAALGLR